METWAIGRKTEFDFVWTPALPSGQEVHSPSGGDRYAV